MPDRPPGEVAAGAERVLRGELELPYPRDQLFDAVVVAARDAVITITAADRDSGTLEGRLPTTLFIWSPALSLRLEATGEAQTRASYQVTGRERRPGSEERILSDTRERLSRLLRGAAAALERAKVPS